MKISENIWLKRIILIIFTMLTLSVFFMDMKVINLEELTGATRLEKFLEKCVKSFNGYDIVYIPTFIVFYYFYYKNYFDERKANKVALVLAIFFSTMMVLGISYKKANSWDLVFLNGFQMLKAIIIALGYCIIFYIIIKKLYIWIDGYKIREKKNKIINFIFEKHPFIVPFTIILLFWLPYIISFYPGTTPGGDTRNEIYSIYHMENATVDAINLISEDVYINNMHPVLHTVILSAFMKLGEIFHNYNLGIFLYTIIQVIITNIALSLIFVWMKKNNIPIAIRIISILVFSLVSFIPLFAINVGKDTYSAIFTIWFIILLFEIIKDSKILEKRAFCIVLILIMLLVMMLRNDGIYRVVIPFLFLIIINKKYWKRLLTLLIIPVSIFEIYSNVILPANKITGGSIREVLSIPFQQTARVVKEHGEDAFEEEDRQIINKILEYETLSEDYNPILSDPVKNKFKKDSTKQDLVEYFKVWFKYLFKYPKDYLQATLNNTYGYFYPNRNHNIGYTTIKKLEDGIFDIKFEEKFENNRMIIEKIHNVAKRIPVIGMLYSVGAHVYFLLISIGYMLYRRKYKYIIALMPLLMVLLICLASPVNGHWRYTLPIIMAFPITSAITIYTTKNGD